MAWTSAEEMRYAEMLADCGYAALSFDFTGFGESQGWPRDYESPALKIRDIHNAVTFLADHPSVDADRIGALGVSAAAVYVSGNAVDDPRVRSLALIAPWLHDRQVCEQVYGGAEGVTAKLDAAAKAFTTYYATTGNLEYVPVVSGIDALAAKPMEIHFYLNRSRGDGPLWPNRFAVMAWKDWLEFDSIALAPRITVPTLIVHSQDAAVPDGARRFHAGLAGPKDIVWTGGTQFDFYGQGPNLTIAVQAAAEHFRTTL